MDEVLKLLSSVLMIDYMVKLNLTVSVTPTFSKSDTKDGSEMIFVGCLINV